MCSHYPSLQVGDVYKASSQNWKELKFDGLKIKAIDYCFGVRLHFDWNEWSNNNPNTENHDQENSNTKIEGI